MRLIGALCAIAIAAIICAVGYGPVLFEGTRLIYLPILLPPEAAKQVVRPTMDNYPTDKLLYVRKFLDDPARSTEDKSIILQPVMWRQNTVITFAFDGGSEKLRSMIEATAKEWTRNSRTLQLQFRGRDGTFLQWSSNDRIPSAMIRVGFDGQGYWSLVGRSNLYVEPSEKTMNLGGFDMLTDADLASESWGASYERTVVLHEFGHVFGFAHEQFHNACQRELLPNADAGYVPTIDPVSGAVAPNAGKRPGYLLYFGGPPNNWSEATTKFNMNRDYYLAETGASSNWPLDASAPHAVDSPQPDKLSIMMYHLPDFIWAGGSNSACFTDTWSRNLTKIDKATFDYYYP